MTVSAARRDELRLVERLREAAVKFAPDSSWGGMGALLLEAADSLATAEAAAARQREALQEIADSPFGVHHRAIARAVLAEGEAAEVDGRDQSDYEAFGG